MVKVCFISPEYLPLSGGTGAYVYYLSKELMKRGNSIGVVTAVQDISPDIVLAQMRAVVDDIGVDAVKTGMLHTSQIIDAVSGELEKYRVPVVVDPVMISKSGATLLLPEAKDTLIRRLLPVATVVTPNAMEAEAISGIHVENIESGKKAAERISSMGPKSVVVKGGHIEGGKAVDILLHNGATARLELLERSEAPDTVRGAVRLARVRVRVNRQEVWLECGKLSMHLTHVAPTDCGFGRTGL